MGWETDQNGFQYYVDDASGAMITPISTEPSVAVQEPTYISPDTSTVQTILDTTEAIPSIPQDTLIPVPEPTQAMVTSPQPVETTTAYDPIYGTPYELATPEAMVQDAANTPVVETGAYDNQGNLVSFSQYDPTQSVGYIPEPEPVTYYEPEPVVQVTESPVVIAPSVLAAQPSYSMFLGSESPATTTVYDSIYGTPYEVATPEAMALDAANTPVVETGAYSPTGELIPFESYDPTQASTYEPPIQVQILNTPMAPPQQVVPPSLPVAEPGSALAGAYAMGYVPPEEPYVAPVVTADSQAAAIAQLSSVPGVVNADGSINLDIAISAGLINTLRATDSSPEWQLAIVDAQNYLGNTSLQKSALQEIQRVAPEAITTGGIYGSIYVDKALAAGVDPSSLRILGIQQSSIDQGYTYLGIQNDTYLDYTNSPVMGPPSVDQSGIGMRAYTPPKTSWTDFFQKSPLEHIWDWATSKDQAGIDRATQSAVTMSGGSIVGMTSADIAKADKLFALPRGLGAIGGLPVVGSSSRLAYQWSSLDSAGRSNALGALVGEIALTGMMVAPTFMAPKGLLYPGDVMANGQIVPEGFYFDPNTGTAGYYGAATPKSTIVTPKYKVYNPSTGAIAYPEATTSSTGITTPRYSVSYTEPKLLTSGTTGDYGLVTTGRSSTSLVTTGGTTPSVLITGGSPKLLTMGGNVPVTTLFRGGTGTTSTMTPYVVDPLISSLYKTAKPSTGVLDTIANADSSLRNFNENQWALSQWAYDMSGPERGVVWPNRPSIVKVPQPPLNLDLGVVEPTPTFSSPTLIGEGGPLPQTSKVGTLQKVETVVDVAPLEIPIEYPLIDTPTRPSVSPDTTSPWEVTSRSSYPKTRTSPTDAIDIGRMTPDQIARRLADRTGTGLVPADARSLGFPRTLDPSITVINPGLTPFRTPEITPFTTPGVTPFRTPGVTPITTPGTSPFTTPGITPGITPSIPPYNPPGTGIPFRTPGTTPVIDPFSTPGSIPVRSPATGFTPFPVPTPWTPKTITPFTPTPTTPDRPPRDPSKGAIPIPPFRGGGAGGGGGAVGGGGGRRLGMVGWNFDALVINLPNPFGRAPIRNVIRKRGVKGYGGKELTPGYKGLRA